MKGLETDKRYNLDHLPDNKVSDAYVLQNEQGPNDTLASVWIKVFLDCVNHVD